MHLVELGQVGSTLALLPERHDGVYLGSIWRIERAPDQVRSKLYMTKKWMAALARETNGVKRLQISASLARWRSGCRRT